MGLDETGKWGEKLRYILPLVGTGLIIALVGNRGSGKTQIAANAINESCKQGRSAMYVSAVEMFMAMRDCYRDGGPSEEQTMRRFCDPRMLVVDQMEERKHSDAEDRMLFSIINTRYNRMNDTLLVSNELPAQFLKSVGASVADRINEAGGLIELVGMSFRQGGAA